MGVTSRGIEFGTSYGVEYMNSVGDVALSLTVPTGAVAALVSVVGAEPIKWRVDGIAPTATVGHPLSVGGHVEVYRDDMHRFEVISGTVSTPTQVFVTYFGE